MFFKEVFRLLPADCDRIPGWEPLETYLISLLCFGCSVRAVCLLVPLPHAQWGGIYLHEAVQPSADAEQVALPEKLKTRT